MATTGNISYNSSSATVLYTPSLHDALPISTINLQQLDLKGGSLALSTVDTSGNNAANATVVNSSGVDLAASTVAGNTSVNATHGNITDNSGSATVQKGAFFSTKAEAATINL